MTTHKTLLMSTGAAALLIAVSFQSTAHATLIASDSFATNVGGDDYAVAQLFGQSPTVGTTGFNGSASWTNATSNTSVNVANTGGLTHVLMSGSAIAGVYQPVFTSGSTGGTAYRNVSRAISYTPTTGTYYMSLLIQGTTTAGGLAGKDGFVGLSTNHDHDTLIGSTTGVYLGLDSADIALLANGSITELVDSSNFTTDEVYLAVAEINFSTTASDSVTASVYNAAGDKIGMQSVTGLNLDGSMGRIAAIAGDASYTSQIKLDEFRFGTELSDVRVVTPEPSTALLALVGLVGCVVRRRRRLRA